MLQLVLRGVLLKLLTLCARYDDISFTFNTYISDKGPCLWQFLSYLKTAPAVYYSETELQIKSAKRATQFFLNRNKGSVCKFITYIQKYV